MGKRSWQGGGGRRPTLDLGGSAALLRSAAAPPTALIDDAANQVEHSKPTLLALNVMMTKMMGTMAQE